MSLIIVPSSHVILRIPCELVWMAYGSFQGFVSHHSLCLLGGWEGVEFNLISKGI